MLDMTEIIKEWRDLAERHIGAERERLLRLADQLDGHLMYGQADICYWKTRLPCPKGVISKYLSG
jgi:hypothetical protein